MASWGDKDKRVQASRRRHTELRVAVGKVLRYAPEANPRSSGLTPIPTSVLGELWQAWEEE